jgi:6-phosphogluconolactonase
MRKRISESTKNQRMKNHYGSLLALTCVSMLSCTSPRELTGSPGAYVTNILSNNVWGYRIDPTTGALKPIAGSPRTGVDPRSVAVDPSGTFAYVANSEGSQNPGNVVGYTINRTTGELKPIAGSTFPAGRGPQSVAVDRSGTFAYVANLNGDNVSGYTINPDTGALKAIAGSPFAAGDGPYSVAVTPSPRFIISAWFSRFSHWFLFKLRPTR